ncbi:hypothetical protein HNR42_001642 [Deinobacterium chartae]|uniref:Neutral zinc metallopeptidase n=1 Tax=Deinobacterium chartae TaxID=521158 RepID=A0A841HXT1_9DEIO|nr:neutral zinc metallopeptidase [Deinobacterium chartae]MBB6098217.1 hypothetical protein [Deinobacterium chartae]
MDWKNMRRSSNVEDRRGSRVPGGLAVGGGAGLLILLAGLLFGVDPGTLSGLLGGEPARQSTRPANDPQAQFASAVLGDTEDTWNRIFAGSGQNYTEPTLVLFEGAVQSACGYASSATGPFYCPGDQKLYLDLSFFDELSNRFGAPGEFARAYVIAHEIGHHVQEQLGILQKTQQQRARLGRTEGNRLTVRTELQADCFAGVWAHYAEQRGLIDTTDIQGAIRAAEAIGDDRLQRESQGYVVPDAFTHGSSAQRARWFQTGLRSGNPGACDTLSIPYNRL